MTEEQIKFESNRILNIVLQSEDDYEALEKLEILLKKLFTKYPNKVY